jgi:SAM-dependent methyltransferase
MIPSAPSLRSYVDAPLPGAVVSAAGFKLEGWAFRADGAPLRAVRASVGGRVVAETNLAFPRRDVNGTFELSPERSSGFAFFVVPPAGVRVTIDVSADFGDGYERLDSVTVRVSTFDPTREDYGSLADPQSAFVLHREHIYGVGPSSPDADPVCVARILERTYPGERIIDVGCGVGAFAAPLIAAGRDWHGCEVVPEFVEAIRGRGLAATVASGSALPFEDGAFDIAIAIEVLEHIDDYEAFVAELARVARRGALVSVPNSGTIPFLAPLGVVPWHLLESSHVNFFTRSSLLGVLGRAFSRVEVIGYGPLLVPATDGTSVDNHLFAVAMHDDADAG